MQEFMDLMRQLGVNVVDVGDIPKQEKDPEVIREQVKRQETYKKIARESGLKMTWTEHEMCVLKASLISLYDYVVDTERAITEIRRQQRLTLETLNTIIQTCDGAWELHVDENGYDVWRKRPTQEGGTS